MVFNDYALGLWHHEEFVRVFGKTVKCLRLLELGSSYGVTFDTIVCILRNNPQITHLNIKSMYVDYNSTVQIKVNEYIKQNKLTVEVEVECID
jgi:hypothetical protein